MTKSGHRERRLTRSEATLWRSVAATARPLPSRSLPAELPPADTDILAQVPDAPAGSARRGGEIVTTPATPMPRSGAAMRRAQRGITSPAARIDLHGHSLAEAHRLLVIFLAACAERRRGCVLVITGKGGAMRREVPLWLETPMLARHVAGYSLAHRRHGGEGALYVFLRLPAAGP